MPSEPRVVEGQLSATGLRFGVVVARFNHLVTDRLLEGALDALSRHGGDLGAVTVLKVPGCFELPVAARRLATGGDVDAVICLGAVIRGATPHFDLVAGACARGAEQVAQQTGVPVAFGVLTTDTLEQAFERAGTKAGNKGFEAAASAIEMADLFARLEGRR